MLRFLVSSSPHPTRTGSKVRLQHAYNRASGWFTKRCCVCFGQQLHQSSRCFVPNAPGAKKEKKNLFSFKKRGAFWSLGAARTSSSVRVHTYHLCRAKISQSISAFSVCMHAYIKAEVAGWEKLSLSSSIHY